VSILDPRPDGMRGTFDDQHLTVYQQKPGTFGRDDYLLTNAPGLRTLNAGLVAEVGTEWRELRSVFQRSATDRRQAATFYAALG
jgi:hypothetical protein